MKTSTMRARQRSRLNREQQQGEKCMEFARRHVPDDGTNFCDETSRLGRKPWRQRSDCQVWRTDQPLVTQPGIMHNGNGRFSKCISQKRSSGKMANRRWVGWQRGRRSGRWLVRTGRHSREKRQERRSCRTGRHSQLEGWLKEQSGKEKKGKEKQNESQILL